MSTNTAKVQLALEKELAQLQNVNSTVDNLISTIQNANVNIGRTKQSTDHTSQLLEDWIRILSQTDFTSKVLNNPKWNGLPDQEGEYTKEEIDSKLEEERALLNELNQLESENQDLLVKIEKKEETDRALEAKARELNARRQRDLGLGFRRGGPRKR